MEFVLTRTMLDGLDVGLDPLGTGLGLAAFILILFPTPESGTKLGLLPGPGATILLGLLPFRAVPFSGLDAGTGTGCSMIVSAEGRKNIPRPIWQSKYLSPCTLPSFLPLSSSSSTPTQSPVAKCGCPMKRTTAMRPSASSTVWPTTSSDIWAHERYRAMIRIPPYFRRSAVSSQFEAFVSTKCCCRVVRRREQNIVASDLWCSCIHNSFSH